MRAVDGDRLANLRGATYRRDGAGIMAALAGAVPEEALQLAGDGLLVALGAETPGADALADACAGRLRDRDWVGDGELASELEVSLGRRPSTGLSALPVDLEELSMVLEASLGENGGAIDRQTGEVWTSYAMEYASENEDEPPDFEDSDRWLYVGPEGSDEGYRDMEDFIATVGPDRADRLSTAIDGRGGLPPVQGHPGPLDRR